MELYLAVRCHGLKTRLLRQKDYEALVKGEKELSELPDYKDIDEEDPLHVKIRKVFEVFNKRVSLLIKIAPDIEPLIRMYPDRLEIENLKIRLRALRGIRVEEYYYPYFHYFDHKTLSSITSERQLWEKINKTPYMQCPRPPSFISNSLAEREAFLDAVYIAYMRTLISKTNRIIRHPLLNFLDLEAISKLVYWKLVLPKEVEFMLRRGLLKDLLPMSISLASLDPINLLSTLKIKREIAVRFVENLDISGMLIAIRRSLLMHLQRIAINHSTGFPYVLFYLALALNEAQNLEKLFIGKHVRMSEEDILSSLCTLY